MGKTTKTPEASNFLEDIWSTVPQYLPGMLEGLWLLGMTILNEMSQRRV